MDRIQKGLPFRNHSTPASEQQNTKSGAPLSQERPTNPSRKNANKETDVSRLKGCRARNKAKVTTPTVATVSTAPGATPGGRVAHGHATDMSDEVLEPIAADVMLSGHTLMTHDLVGNQMVESALSGGNWAHAMTEDTLPNSQYVPAVTEDEWPHEYNGTDTQGTACVGPIGSPLGLPMEGVSMTMQQSPKNNAPDNRMSEIGEDWAKWKTQEQHSVAQSEKQALKDRTTENHPNITNSGQNMSGAQLVVQWHPGKDALEPNSLERVRSVVTMQNFLGHNLTLYLEVNNEWWEKASINTSDQGHTMNVEHEEVTEDDAHLWTQEMNHDHEVELVSTILHPDDVSEKQATQDSQDTSGHMEVQVHNMSHSGGTMTHLIQDLEIQETRDNVTNDDESHDALKIHLPLHVSSTEDDNGDAMNHSEQITPIRSWEYKDWMMPNHSLEEVVQEDTMEHCERSSLEHGGIATGENAAPILQLQILTIATDQSIGEAKVSAGGCGEKLVSKIPNCVLDMITQLGLMPKTTMIHVLVSDQGATSSVLLPADEETIHDDGKAAKNVDG